MQNAFAAGAVVYAKDIQRISRFYSQIAGLRVKQEEQGFVVLESSAFEIVVVATPPAIASKITISSPPQRRENTAIKLCFAVASIASAREAAARLGGELNGPEREWNFAGQIACDGHDPEGNVIQVRAPAL